MRVEIGRAERLRGEVTPPPDKSISHRAVMLSSIAKGTSVIRNLLRAGDTMSTLNAMRALGVDIKDREEIIIEGGGLYGLKEPSAPIDCGNSGTTMRLLSGILSGNPFFSVLTGDESLRSRPMKRVVDPLREMGARIMGRDEDRYPPLAIRGGALRPIRYEMPVASAQVKSAILLAGLYAEGETGVVEPVKSRDHTERMLPSYGADVRREGLVVSVKGPAELRAHDIAVPGDFSSAAFFIVGALIVPGSEILVKGVGLNPTRTGLLSALEKMGAEIKTENLKELSGEPVGDLYIKSAGGLKGIEITGETLPSLIDEFSVLCIAGAIAEGTTAIRGAGELRVKESDRVRAMSEGLKRMGADVEEHTDGLSIKGGSLKGAEVDSRGDHRIAMAFSIAGLIAKGKTTVRGAEAANISFPGFYKILEGLTR